MKIRVGFSRTDRLWSRILRWFMQSEASHSYVRLYDEYLHAPLIIHADFPGVIFEHAEIFDRDNIVIEEFEIDDERLDDGFRANLKHLRKKYNYMDILNWALVIKFGRWFKRKVRRPTEDPKKFICADLVVKLLNDSNITHLPLGDLHVKRLRVWFEDNYESFGWRKIYFKNGKEIKS